MTRDQIIKIAMVVCAVVLLCAVILNFTGGFGTSGIASYDNADKYASGDTEINGSIRSLDVHWVSGKVIIATHSGNQVTLRETAARALSEDEKFQWWVDGDTLRVQFTKPGIRLNMPGKELTLTLPEGIDLENVKIEATSGEIEIPALKTDTLKLGVTSGSIQATAEAKKAEIGSTSGKHRIRLTGETESVRISATSGDIQLEADKAGSIDAGSTSGRISVTAAECDRTKVTCTSGTVEVRLGKFNTLEAGTTSGKITAALPDIPGFTAQIGTTSGKVSSDLPMKQEGDRYTCGDGSGKVTIHATSGDVKILRAEK